MTLILATVIGECVVIAADHRIHCGPEGGPYESGEGDKLFTNDLCVVASYGTSPPDYDVPALIRRELNQYQNPYLLTQSLHQEISSLANFGAVGLLVGGFGTEGHELWDAKPPNGIQRLNTNHQVVHTRGACEQELIRNFSNTQELNVDLISIFAYASQLTDTVGAPYEIATLKMGLPTVIQRFCAHLP